MTAGRPPEQVRVVRCWIRKANELRDCGLRTLLGRRSSARSSRPPGAKSPGWTADPRARRCISSVFSRLKRGGGFEGSKGMRRVEAVELCSEQGDRTRDCTGESRAHTCALTWVRCVPVGGPRQGGVPRRTPSSSWACVRSWGAERRASVSKGLTGLGGASVLRPLFLSGRAL